MPLPIGCPGGTRSGGASGRLPGFSGATPGKPRAGRVVPRKDLRRRERRGVFRGRYESLARALGRRPGRAAAQGQGGTGVPARDTAVPGAGSQDTRPGQCRGGVARDERRRRGHVRPQRCVVPPGTRSEGVLRVVRVLRHPREGGGPGHPPEVLLARYGPGPVVGRREAEGLDALADLQRNTVKCEAHVEIILL